MQNGLASYLNYHNYANKDPSCHAVMVQVTRDKKG